MSFDLFFGGAEQPHSVDLLVEAGSQNYVVSFYEWKRRHTGNLDLSQFFDRGLLCVVPGVSKKTNFNWHKFCNEYRDFVLLNAGNIALALEIDNDSCPHEERFELRFSLADLGRKLVVFPSDDAQLVFLDGYRIGLNAKTAKQITHLGKTPVHLVNTTSEKLIMQTRAVSASTYAWLSPRRYGEAWVYDQKLIHYQADELKALENHKSAIEKLEVNVDDALKGDKTALQILAVRSLQAMADKIASTMAPKPRPKLVALEGGKGVVMTDSHGRNERRSLLPGLVQEMTADQDISGLYSFGPELFRQCSSCSLANVCPRFEAGSDCAFEVPTRIQTPQDVEVVCKALLEIQFRRIGFSYFAEQLEGVVASKAVGQEIDRFFKLLTELKALSTLAPPSSKEGILSQIIRQRALGAGDGVHQSEE